MIPDATIRRRLWQYLRPYWKLELAMFFTMAVLTALMLAMPFAVAYMIDDLIPNLVAETQRTGQVDMTPILLFAAFLAGIYLANTLFGLGRDYIAGKVGASIIADMRSQMFEHLCRVPLRFYQKNQVGEIMSRLMSDVQRVQGLLAVTLVMFLTNVLMLAAVLAVLLSTNWQLTLVALVPVPLSIFISNRFGRRLHVILNRLQEKIAQLSGHLAESFGAIRTIRAFAQERREKRKLDRLMGDLTGLYIVNSVTNSLAVNFVHFINMIAPVVILSWGTYLVAGGSMQLGQVIAFYMMTAYLFSPVQDLATMAVQVQAEMAAVYRIFEYLDIQPAVTEDANPATMGKVEGRIAFEEIRFAYEDNDFALCDLTLTVEPGETVAIVGPSGSGKTTIINLLLRFFDPHRGTISIDGMDIRRLAVKELRANIGLVDQDPVLFKGSIRENIAYGDEEATAEQVAAAARIANIHDFIERLPNGYETEVGERGVTLSGGERQRVCLARAVLKNPPIMLLDEATSALDTRNEELIQVALEKALKGKTAIIIAHRLATVRHADRIIVLDGGGIVAQGTHEQLLACSPLYKELAQKQLLAV